LEENLSTIHDRADTGVFGRLYRTSFKIE